MNNLYVWEMSRKLSVQRFKWVEDYIKSLNEKSIEGYFPEVDVQYPKNLNEPQNDLQFLPEIKKVDKVKKLVANL